MKWIDLVITYGISDVQILLQDHVSGCATLLEPDTKCVRDFHDLLQEHLDEVDIVSEIDAEHLIKKGGRFYKVDKTDRRFYKDKGDPLYPLEARLQIVLPKVERVLRVVSKSYQLNRILLLGARKDGDNEPHAFRILLKKFIDDHLNKQPDHQIDIRQEFLLEKNELLEGQHGVYAVSDTAYSKLNEIVFDFFKDQEPSTDTVLLSAGGLPPIKPLLRELVSLYARNQVMVIPALEERSAQGVSLSENELETYDPNQDPLHLAQTRRLALEWVRRGGFSEAFTVAAHLSQDVYHADWVSAIKAVSDLIVYGPDEQINQARVGNTFNSVLALASDFLSPLVALRVESYLLNHRILEALNATVTFIDVLIDDFIRHDDNFEQYDPENKKIIIRNDAVAQRINEFSSDKEKILEPEGKPGQYVIKNPVLFKKYMESEYSKYKSFYQISNFVKHARSYRNLATHALLTPEQYDDMLEKMCSKVHETGWVWNPALLNGTVQPGKAFWRSSVVQNILRQLTGKDSLAGLFEGLIKDLEIKILAA